MSISDKNLREKEFHNKLQSKKKGRFENIFINRSLMRGMISMSI